jgi:hypothetical protein
MIRKKRVFGFDPMMCDFLKDSAIKYLQPDFYSTKSHRALARGRAARVADGSAGIANDRLCRAEI